MMDFLYSVFISVGLSGNAPDGFFAIQIYKKIMYNIESII